jgi:hypothetical protein
MLIIILQLIPMRLELYLVMDTNMKLLIIALLLSGCSMLKSNPDRCFDLMEQTDGKAHIIFKDGHKSIECGNLNNINGEKYAF